MRLKELDKQLHHIQVQEGASSDALEAAGMDFDLMPPLSPLDVIKVCLRGCGQGRNYRRIE